MQRLIVIIGTTIGGSIGWWLGRHVGIMTAFLAMVVGTAAGAWSSRRFIADHLP